VSRSGSLAGDSLPAGVILAVRPEGWVIRWARLLGVAVSLGGLLVSTGCQPTSDMVMRKDLEEYKASQKAIQDKQNEDIESLLSRLNSLQKTSAETDGKIQQSLDAEKTSREADVRGVSERIDKVEQTIKVANEDFKQEIARYSDLKTQQLGLEERFDQLSKDVRGKVADVNTKVAEFSEQFSTDVATLRSEYQSLLIALKEHYQTLSVQLKRGQDDIKTEIEGFGELAKRMAEHSRSMVEKASKIMDAIEEQTREFRSELERRTEPQETEQQTPTKGP
jgi:chromosome segregation ATPase